MPVNTKELPSLFANAFKAGDELPKKTKPRSVSEMIAAKSGGHGSLAARYIVPPFSILDAKQGYWLKKQERWMHVFDPLLSEIIYKWFLPSNNGDLRILDPFGDFTRGAVAGTLGHKYCGYEPNKTKASSYFHQAKVLAQGMWEDREPFWFHSDPLSGTGIVVGKNRIYDLVFTSVPIYKPSDVNDKKNERIKNIFSRAALALKQNRFFVVLSRPVYTDDGSCIVYSPEEVSKLLDGIPDLGYYNRAEVIASTNVLTSVKVYFKGDAKQIPKEFPAL